VAKKNNYKTMMSRNKKSRMMNLMRVDNVMSVKKDDETDDIVISLMSPLSMKSWSKLS